MRLLAKVSALDGLSGSLRTLALAQLSAESGVRTFGASNLECAGLTALSWSAALTQAPTADASKNSQQALQVHFEDKSLRNVRFKNAASFSVPVWGRCQASANESGVKPSHSKKPRPLVVAEKRPNSERSRSAPFRK